MINSKSNPIFILASERSGTNLLRSLLSNHSQICGPVAPHFIDAFSGINYLYGDLSQKENMSLLFHHMLKLVKHEYNTWQITIDFDTFYEKYYPKNLLEAAHSFYMEETFVNSKQTYVSKDNHNFNYVHLITRYFPKAKFIYLVRDPRDHVASWKITPLFIKTSYDAIVNWVKEQKICTNLMWNYNIDITAIKYEDLIENTPFEMTKLLKFLELDIEENCFATDQEKNKDVSWNKFWKNLSKPVMKTNKAKYKKVLSSKEILMTESLAKEIMNFWHYELETNATWTPPAFWSFRVIMRRIWVSYKFKKHLQEDMKKLKAKLALMNSIHNDVKNNFKKKT